MRFIAPPTLALCTAAVFFAHFTGCSPGKTRVEVGNEKQILHYGNGDEIEGLDPQTSTGVPEHNIISALFEGLVSEDPKDLHPVPGVAESWDVSDDKQVYTFHLREDAKWSNGDSITAQDFYESYKRMLDPALAAEYANMLFVVENAEDYYNGKIKDFSDVGFEVVDERTFRIRLVAPTPYFLWMLGHHYSWWPVPISVIEQHGGLTDKSNPWTRLGNIVGNGPFVLNEWRLNQVISVTPNPHYWDKETVKLKEIRFYPITSADTEERAFRSGQLHLTQRVPPQKIEVYKRENPEALHISPYLGVYFYRINTTHSVLTNKLVRQALARAVDRKAIVENITKAAQIPAHHYTPPNTAGYTAQARIPTDFQEARELLAEAGFPDGEGFPNLEILFNTDEAHRAIAEAIQQMWRKNLNINVSLLNQEWKVYLDSQDTLNYHISRAGWIGDYVDPNTFLEMWQTSNGNNDTGWSNKKYDELIDQARVAGSSEERYEFFQQAEAILLEEAPVIPIYFYTRPYLLKPSVKGWYDTILDHHPYKHVYLESFEQEQE